MMYEFYLECWLNDKIPNEYHYHFERHIYKHLNQKPIYIEKKIRNKIILYQK